MVSTVVDVSSGGYDRMAELKSFDESKAGVKGLADSGIKAPPQFLESGTPYSPNDPNFIFPVIDLAGVHQDPVKRKQMVEKIRDASGSWGFFQIVNHGVPKNIQEDMTSGVRNFFDLDLEQKKDYYARDIVPKYSAEMARVGDLLFQLLSEALGLESNYLKEIDCVEAMGYAYHYYPPCPQPELALGCVHHTDIDFLTVILQDQVGGLQVLRHNSWIDVPYVPGALVVNIGDMLQCTESEPKMPGQGYQLPRFSAMDLQNLRGCMDL
ncbi:1-aminocyclopropane-1-carboxylate oxidase homolog 1 [Linum perenne]